MEDPLPCPYCSRDPDIYVCAMSDSDETTEYVTCDPCGCVVRRRGEEAFVVFPDEESAINAWNLYVEYIRPHLRGQ
jgi:hypothetical protein